MGADVLDAGTPWTVGHPSVIPSAPVTPQKTFDEPSSVVADDDLITVFVGIGL